MNFKGLSLPGYKVGFVMKGEGSEGEVIGSNPQLTKKLTINNQHLPIKVIKKVKGLSLECLFLISGVLWRSLVSTDVSEVRRGPEGMREVGSEGVETVWSDSNSVKGFCGVYLSVCVCFRECSLFEAFCLWSF